MPHDAGRLGPIPWQAPRAIPGAVPMFVHLAARNILTSRAVPQCMVDDLLAWAGETDERSAAWKAVDTAAVKGVGGVRPNKKPG